MRLSATLLCLVVLCLSPALAQSVTDGAGVATVGKATVFFDAVKSSTGTVPVLYKPTETKDTKAENIHDIIIWRSATVPTGYTIEDPLRATSDPEMLALPLEAQISVQGHAAILLGLQMGLHPRPASNVTTTVVLYTINGVQRSMSYEIRWATGATEPTITRIPSAEPTPTVG